MPIIIKKFEWSESDTKLDITLPQRNIKANNIDVMCTPVYIKVNYNPYFFELHLKEKIDDNKTRVVIEDSTIKLYLSKLTIGIWEDIANPAAKNSTTRRELVATAHQYHEDKTKADVEERNKVKAEQKKWALRKAMDQDSSEKDRIEAVKQAERDKVNKEMDDWQNLDDDEKRRQYAMSIKENADPAELESEYATVTPAVTLATPAVTLATPVVTPEDSPCDIEPENRSLAQERAKKFEKIKHNLANPLKTSEPKCTKKPVTKKQDDKPLWEINGPRQRREIEVTFSKRYFPSAARESLAADEEAWIEKNMKAQTVVKPKDDDTKDDERNPMWLNDKAGAFYKSGNFPAAINAYSEAISISPNLPKLYINRASCYIVLNLFEDCVTDCTRALELLTPPVEANRLSRVRTLAKRGSAYCQLGQHQQALVDYKLASRLEPEDSSLKGDIEVLEGQITHLTAGSTAIST